MLPGALMQKLAAKPNKRKNAPVAAAATAADAPLPKRKVKAQLAAAHRRPLTTDDINRLQEASSTLTNESMFALQIDEILRASQLPDKYDRFVYNWLNEFNTMLHAIPSDETKVTSAAVPADDAASGHLPWDDTVVTVPAFHYQFVAPRAKATVIGSYATRTLNGPAVVVDVAVEMPAQFFQKHDHLNLIYHKKRALYVQRLAQALAQWPSGATDVRFVFAGGDRLRPVVEVRAPKAAGVRQLRIRVHAAGEPNAFKLSRFLPATSNVRASLFGDAVAEADAEPLPTPHYNASVLRDLTLQQNEQFVQRMLAPEPQRPVREALRLCKLWLRARGLGDASLGGAVLSAFAVLLIKQRRLPVTMSAYDVLRQLWIALASSRWHEDGHGGSLAPQPAAELATFHRHYDVVLLDVSGYLNLCAGVPLDVYLRVREESQRALRFVAEEATLATFRLLFASGGRPVWQQYDHVIHITRNANLAAIVRSDCYRAQYHDHCGQVLPIAQDLVLNVLRHGFGRRIDSLTPLSAPPASWPLHERPPAPDDRLCIGVVLNVEFCTDVLDKGPQADQTVEADAFKSFWGSRSEMRRFQDGSIVEACAWSSPAAPLAERRLVCRQIALHLLQHHFTIEPQHVHYVADQTDIAYRLDAVKVLSAAPSNSEHLALAAVRSFDELGRQLRALDDLPLAITAVTGASPVFRYCEVEPIVALAAASADGNVYHSYAVLDAVIELAASGRWPDHLAALQRLKAAFCLRIASGLRDQCQLQARTNGHWVDVLKDGYLFRLRIAVAKELMLLKRTLTAKAVTAYKDTEQSRAFERDLLRRPRLTQLLHTLYQRHSSFGPAVAIAKRWLRAQLLDAGLWPDECTELLMAHVYTQSGTWPAAAQPQAGFVRWLQLVAASDWRTDMVVLNFNDGLTTEQLSRLEARWLSDRDAFPVLCIVTPAATATTSTVAAAAAAQTNQTSAWTVWTEEAPLREVVARVAVLAGHSLDLVERSVLPTRGKAVALDAQLLFVPSLEGYDVLIRLRRARVQQSNVCELGATQARARTVDEAAPAADFNIVERYLAELREAYAEFALFFYDSCGGEVIAVMWKPAVRVEREFAASTVLGCHEQSGTYVCNLKQIVEDFRLMGHGLVETVTETATGELVV